MSEWNFTGRESAYKNWPRKENGEPETPVFLMHVPGIQMDSDMVINMLGAYGIPALCQYPVDGSFGKVILGFSGAGLDIFVPESLLQDAQNIVSTDAEFEDEEE